MYIYTHQFMLTFDSDYFQVHAFFFSLFSCIFAIDFSLNYKVVREPGLHSNNHLYFVEP